MTSMIEKTYLISAVLLSLLLSKWLVCGAARAFGSYLKRKTTARRQAVLKRVKIEEQAVESFYRRAQKGGDDGWKTTESGNGGQAASDWEGVVGFFHPFCNAGGGGERVLWAAIRATQKRWPKAVCVVYTGDHDATKPAILERVQNRFNIRLHPPTVVFIYLSTRHYALSSTYPHFTLLGQSLGSLILGYDAFSLLVPHIFIDTMGYAFTLALSKFLFPKIPTGAYVHYPTISTDMLGSLDAEAGKGLNTGSGKGWKGALKRRYWHIFAWMYCWVGGTVDVVMTNSSWTQGHIRSLWGPNRTKRQKSSDIEVVFPPVAVEELEQAIEISESSETQREKALLYVAQFRPEKNHGLILRSFSRMLHSETGDTAKAVRDAKLVLVGSVRDSEDATRVYNLRLLAHELKIKNQVEFVCDAPWSHILDRLRRSWVGVNGMWNEHFGIGVVEYQAAGLISVVNDSGGPKRDIVVEWNGGPTGFHASTESDFAASFEQALSMSPKETLEMRRRARSSARRFTEEAFANSWIMQMERLVQLEITASSWNILFLPFRRTHPVSMSEAIKQYISTKYDQHPDMFLKDLEAIDKLRTNAVNTLEAHVSGIKKLTAYAAQLVFIGGKFPIDIGVDFVWYPALGFNTQRPISENNLRFELANVLWNLAALYSQLAVSLNRSTSEGLKSACNYFCQAAGVLSHIRTEIIPDMRTLPPDDMDTMTLESLQQLMLAQAQECFWSKAVKDGMKDGLIAKLAAKVSDFYDQAAEFGTKSDTVSTEWIHHMTAKHHHFAAAAQYRASRECLEKQKYGEEVARLRDSLTCVNEALKEARWINKIVLGDLNGLRSRVTEDLKRAEKDNDIIYLMTVPPKSELKTLDRAGMATPKVPQEVSEPASTLGENGMFGQPLFAKLVPYAVHIAASIYEERKNRLINTTIIEELEGLSKKLRELLQSLNLPGSLQALEKPLGLPPALTAHAEEIRQQEGLHRLRRTTHETSRLKANDEAVYKEGNEILRSEAAEDDRARLKYGTERWTRPSSQQAAGSLYQKSTEIDGYLKSASSSDELVQKKLKEHEGVIQVLSGTDRDLEEYVPSSRRTQIPPNLQRAVGTLSNVLSDVRRMESRRKRVAENLREKGKQDEINTVILAETARLEREYPMQKIEPAQFEHLFERRLERYDSDRQVVVDEEQEQKQLESQIQEANKNFLLARRGDTASKEREQALQRLENAFFKYKEIVSNLNASRKFYNDLANIVNRFRDDCKNFAYQRRIEATQWESDLSSGISSLSLQQTQNLQEQKQRDLPPYGARPPAAEPLTAPTPTRAQAPQPQPGMWNPEMGIKFAGNGPNGVSGAAGQKPAKGGQWDASRGVKFG